MNWQKLLTPFKALGYPILPIVPECSYCAAMRFCLLSSMLTGMGVGFALKHSFFGLIIGSFYGIIGVFTLWAEYKFKNKGK